MFTTVFNHETNLYDIYDPEGTLVASTSNVNFADFLVTEYVQVAYEMWREFP